MKLRTSGVAIVLVAVIALCWVFSDPLLYAAGSVLVHSDSPAKADMAVVIGGDYKGNRILRSGELVRDSFVPSVLVSGIKGIYGRYESEMAVDLAADRGFPREAFIASHYAALSTRDEAHADVADMRARGVHSFILVTSDFHTARARRIFLREAAGMTMTVIAAPDPDWNNGRWWTSREGRKLWFYEMSKTLADYLGI